MDQPAAWIGFLCTEGAGAVKVASGFVSGRTVPGAWGWILAATWRKGGGSLGALGFHSRTLSAGPLRRLTFASPTSGGWTSKVKVLAGLVSAEASPGSQTASSCCVLTWGKGWELSGVPFIRALIPFVRPPPSGPYQPPKPPPPDQGEAGQLRGPGPIWSSQT